MSEQTIPLIINHHVYGVALFLCDGRASCKLKYLLHVFVRWTTRLVRSSILRQKWTVLSGLAVGSRSGSAPAAPHLRPRPPRPRLSTLSTAWPRHQPEATRRRPASCRSKSDDGGDVWKTGHGKSPPTPTPLQRLPPVPDRRRPRSE